MKTLTFNILLFLSYSLFINTASFASPVEKSGFKLSYYNLEVKSDSIVTDTIAEKKSFLLDKVLYNASDSVSIDPNRKSIHLYNNAKIVYTQPQISFPFSRVIPIGFVNGIALRTFIRPYPRNHPIT